MLNSASLRRNQRDVLSAALACLVAGFCGCSASAKDSPQPAHNLGIVTQPPAGVRAVKIDGGYMVPYTETIPGTDVTFEMIPVPGGEFLMGSPAGEADRGDDEGPQVRVKVESFWMGKCEITWAEYHAYMAMYDAFKTMQQVAMNTDGQAAKAAANELKLIKMHAWNDQLEMDWNVDAVTTPTPLYDSSFTYGVGDQPNQPAVTMTAFSAKQYTKWLSGMLGSSYRLPTEAEWEYAARAGTTTAWSFGDDASKLQEYAWTDDNGDAKTHPVGTKKPNPWGLYDMHGNVAEWTLDQYDAKTYKNLDKDLFAAGTKADAAAIKAQAAIRWPTKLFPRSIRGGSWLEPAAMSRSAARHKSDDSEWNQTDPNIPKSPWWFTEEAATAVGMRIIRPLKPLTDEDKKRVWEADIDDVRLDVKERLREGRGAIGVADEKLPEAVKAADKLNSGS